MYAQGQWSAENLIEATRIIADGNRHVDAWLALAPPPEVADLWQKLLSLLEDFGPLLDEVHSLTGAPPASVRPLVAAFRSRFRRWLCDLIDAEGELVDAQLKPARRET